MRCKLSFALLGSAVQCIRGARSAGGHAHNQELLPTDLVIADIQNLCMNRVVIFSLSSFNSPLSCSFYFLGIAIFFLCELHLFVFYFKSTTCSSSYTTCMLCTLSSRNYSVCGTFDLYGFCGTNIYTSK